MLTDAIKAFRNVLYPSSVIPYQKIWSIGLIISSLENTL